MSKAKNNQEPANNDNKVLANVLLSVDDFRFDKGNSDFKASAHTGKSMYSAQETERLMKEYAEHVFKHRLILHESEKAQMANEWSSSRSVGNRDQDRDCYYHFLNGIESTLRKLSNVC